MKKLKLLTLIVVGSFLVACGNDHEGQQSIMNSWTGVDVNSGLRNEKGDYLTLDKLLDCRVKESKNLHLYYQIFKPNKPGVVSDNNGIAVTEYDSAIVSLSAVYDNRSNNKSGMTQMVYGLAKVIILDSKDAQAVIVEPNPYLINQLENVKNTKFNVPDINNGEDFSLSFNMGKMCAGDPVMNFMRSEGDGIRNHSLASLPGLDSNSDYGVRLECK